MLTAPFTGGKFTLTSMMSLEPAMEHDGYPLLFATGEEAYGQPAGRPAAPARPVHGAVGPARPGRRQGHHRVPLRRPGGRAGARARARSCTARARSITPRRRSPITGSIRPTSLTAWSPPASPRRSGSSKPAPSAAASPTSSAGTSRARSSTAGACAPASPPRPHGCCRRATASSTRPRPPHPGENEHRTIVSAQYNNGKGLAAMAGFSAKDRVPGRTLTAWLGEANWDLTRHHTLFGRIENVDNDELFPDPAEPAARCRVPRDQVPGRLRLSPAARAVRTWRSAATAAAFAQAGRARLRPTASRRWATRCSRSSAWELGGLRQSDGSSDRSRPLRWIHGAPCMSGALLGSAFAILAWQMTERT